MAKDIRLLMERFTLPVNNLKLMQEAFTHASYVNEHRIHMNVHNERLEFLGDAVLELCVSEYLFEHFPQRSEGELTRMRAAIVCEPALQRYAIALKLGDFVRLGRGEEQTGGRQRPSLLADLFEAFVGAMYLDMGIAVVQQFLRGHIIPLIDFDGMITIDYKSQLQEFLQQTSRISLEYRIADERGPAHDREFWAEVYLEERCLGRGSGRSKKEAEQRAAAQALRLLGVQTASSPRT
jgi:ribonuclease-3